MTDIIKGGLAAASALYLIHIASEKETKELLSNKKVAHGAIGAVIGVVGGEKLEYLARNGVKIPEHKQEIIKKTILGMVLGGATFYAFSDGKADAIKSYLGFKPHQEQQKTLYENKKE